MAKGRVNRFVSELRRLEERIEQTFANAHNGRAARRRELYFELLRVLNGSGGFRDIPEHVPNSAALTTRITKLLEKDEFALPRAIYDSTAYGRSIDSALQQNEVSVPEWTFANRIARELNVEPSFGQDELTEKPRWMADVDESHTIVRIWIRELALQDMLLAGIEAFLVPAGAGKPSTEIYGIVFGSFREATRRRGRSPVLSVVDLNVERICIQVRAKGTPSEVFADERSERTHLAMAEELFPFWHLLGDFHTHTYRSLSEVYQRHGWRYSQFDEQMNIEWCRRMVAIGHKPRIALILTITRAGRHVHSPEENWRGLPYVLRTSIGECHCFISAYRIRADGRYSTDGVSLRCPHLTGSSRATETR